MRVIIMKPHAPIPSSAGGSNGGMPEKYSELLLEFAAPLFEYGEPPDRRILRAGLGVAVLCWNTGALELAGDPDHHDLLDKLTTGVPPEGQGLVRQLLAARKARYRSIPFLFDADVIETDATNVRVEVRAYLPKNASPPGGGAPPMLPPELLKAGGMQPFDTVFAELAARESRAWIVKDQRSLPPGTYVLRELYCTELDCDCRRVLVQVTHAESRTLAATINYAFEPPSDPRFSDERQCELDRINPQGPHARELMAMFLETVTTDRAYYERLVRHYAMWKRVVDDEAHPSHGKVRGATHSDPQHVAAFPRQELSQRYGAKVPVNASCPCGSGRKYKKCCRV